MGYTIITKEVCEELESMNLSYEEMCKLFSIKVSPSHLRNKFHKYRVQHKNKYERLAMELTKNNDCDKSYLFICRKYKVSTKTVLKTKNILRRIK